MDTLLIIVLFLLIPVYTIECLVVIEDWRKRSIRKTLVNAITRFSKENNLEFTEFEFFRNKVIGIDSINRKLIFADYRKEAIRQFCIDLDKYSVCSIKKMGDKSLTRVREVFLEMKCKLNNRDFKLKFFERSVDDIRASGLLFEKAKRWKDKIDLRRSTLILNH